MSLASFGWFDRRNFAEVIAKEVASREPDDLKDKARIVFNFPPKGRNENQREIARTFLVERVRLRFMKVVEKSQDSTWKILIKLATQVL